MYLAVFLKCCCGVLAGEALEVGQGFIPAVAVLYEDVQVDCLLVRRLSNVQSVLKVPSSAAHLQSAQALSMLLAMCAGTHSFKH